MFGLVLFLTIIPRTYYWLGNAAYLIVVLGFLSISGGSSIIMNVLASCAGLFGMMIAFVHHVVRSKIINDLNHGITSQELAQQLIQEGSCQMNDQLQACVSEQIFTGRYITTKAAAISILSIISLHLLLGTFDSMHIRYGPWRILGDNLVVAYLPVMVIFHRYISHWKLDL